MIKMHWRTITHLIGILLMLFSLSFIPSMAVSLWYADGEIDEFLISFVLTLIIGFLLCAGNRRAREELNVRDGFLFVTMFWLILSVAGSLPFQFGIHLNFTDAMFESVSGFTTTGATIISSIDRLPPSILYHRQQIQWLGGMGVIVLAVAVLPLLGVGGMQLYQAEASGIARQERLTPRIAQTARSLWGIYFILTLVCAMAYWSAGMGLFDAVGHAFSTIATGGFSTHDASIGYFDNPVLEIVAVVFMLIAGINFAIHFVAIRRQTMQPYFAEPEVRSYWGIFLFATAFVSLSLYLTNVYSGAAESVRHGIFQVASVLTSTGYTTATFSMWPLYIPIILITLSFIGGCVGSTAGGIKVLRILLLAKIGRRELMQLAHPQSVSMVSLGHDLVAEEILFSVKGFFILYMVSALLLTGGMMATGLDLESAFGAVLATINLLGPGLGEVSTTFTSVDSTAKWLAMFGMLLGRLEIFTLLILFLPSYWRH